MTKRMYHFLGLTWLAIILSLGFYSAQTLFVQGKIQFDLLALLPEGKTDKMLISNQLIDDANVSGRVVIMFGHENAEKAKMALLQFRRSIEPLSLPVIEQDIKKIEVGYKNLFASLYPYRAGLLSANDRELLRIGEDNVLLARAIANIMSPFGSFSAEQIGTDPFGFYPQFVTSLYAGSTIQADETGNLVASSESKNWYIYQGHVTEKAFSLKLQEKISESLLPILNNISEETGVETLKLGAAFYASAGAEQAKSDISMISLISTLGIILILLLVFRVPTPIILAVTVVTSGLIGGLAVCLLLFGSIHILALVFGCSLVGVAVDYALHYYCASFKQIDGKSIDRRRILSVLLPALPLGVLTSSIGYGLLIVAPFPGIQQMAVLACVGLLCTFLSVSLWGSYFIKSGERKPTCLANYIQKSLEKLAALGTGKYLRLCLSAILIAIFCIGCFSLNFDDNVRSFQSLDPQLKIEEDRIKSMMSFDNSTKFIAVTGPDLETILQTEEAIIEKLKIEKVSYKALSDLIPSQSRQKANAALKLAFSQNYFPTIAKTLSVDETFDTQQAGFMQTSSQVNGEFLKQLPTGWRELIHIGQADSFTSRIMLNGVVSNKSIEKLLANANGAQLIDPVQEYTSLFSSYREVMMLLITSLLIGFTLMISLRQGIKTAVTITTPVLLSILTTVGILGVLGIGFSMFHAMGLILVLCIGIDYALFLYWREHNLGHTDGELLLLGNGLAAITTILSFGLLSLSTTNAVHSFGLVIFMGIVLNFFITTLFLGDIRCKN